MERTHTLRIKSLELGHVLSNGCAGQEGIQIDQFWDLHLFLLRLCNGYEKINKNIRVLCQLLCCYILGKQGKMSADRRLELEFEWGFALPWRVL